MKYFWAKGDGKLWDEWCTDSSCCKVPGYHFFGPPNCCERKALGYTTLPPSFVRCDMCGEEWEPQPQPLPHAAFLELKSEAQAWLVFVQEMGEEA